MEWLTILPAIFTTFGATLAAFAMYKSARNLKRRLRIEKTLAHNLAIELKARKIESIVNVELNKITISSRVEKKDIDAFKKQIDSAMNDALKKLIKSEQELVKVALEQQSKQGEIHYLKKIVSNSLHEIKA
ncbi:hypothetical protein VXS02_04255 [Photobacterium piscicola]|uniref:hypothetical protein n=1 Tax=Photobacterium piscicola TaxID=1378299 RepID=UPI002E19B4DB|nr:hypothetical protein [Photobacterium piscicola]